MLLTLSYAQVVDADHNLDLKTNLYADPSNLVIFINLNLTLLLTFALYLGADRSFDLENFVS